jgi:hypothetical protein
MPKRVKTVIHCPMACCPPLGLRRLGAKPADGQTQFIAVRSVFILALQQGLVVTAGNLVQVYEAQCRTI